MDARTTMNGYGQFCPVARAAEILDQRWMLLVVRELVAGSDRFNEIHRGVPRMSRTLLAKRLRQLVDAGLVVRQEEDDIPHYRLTDAGRELRSVVDALGTWGARWMDSLADEHLDPALLMLDVQRRIDRGALPDGQTVLEVNFTDLDDDIGQWWLLLRAGEVEVCREGRGSDADVTIESRIRCFVRLWHGEVGWDRALRGDGMHIEGPAHLRRRVPEWLRLGHSTSVSRPSEPHTSVSTG